MHLGAVIQCAYSDSQPGDIDPEIIAQMVKSYQVLEVETIELSDTTGLATGWSSSASV